MADPDRCSFCKFVTNPLHKKPTCPIIKDLQNRGLPVRRCGYCASIGDPYPFGHDKRSCQRLRENPVPPEWVALNSHKY